MSQNPDPPNTRVSEAIANMPEQVEQAAQEMAGWFQPKGDPYFYKVEGDTLRFYHPDRGFGKISVQQVVQNNPEWARLNLQGRKVSNAASAGQPSRKQQGKTQQSTNNAQQQRGTVSTSTGGADTPPPEEEAQFLDMVSTLRQAVGQAADEAGDTVSSVARTLSAAAASGASAVSKAAAPVAGAINKAANTRGIGRPFNPQVQKIGGGPGMLKNVDVTSPIATAKSIASLYRLWKSGASAREIARTALGFTPDVRSSRRLPPPSGGQVRRTSKGFEGTTRGAAGSSPGPGEATRTRGGFEAGASTTPPTRGIEEDFMRKRRLLQEADTKQP